MCYQQQCQLEEELMAKIGQMLESKYLKGSDVEHETVVTVVKVGQGNIAKPGEEQELKWMVRFEELAKPMILNSTNIKRLAKACQSEDTDDWIGKKVVVYFDPDIEFAGNVVGGLRIKAHHGSVKVKGAPGTALADMDSDIPF